MSRSGYSDDCENVGLWRGAVHRATVGKRGQQFFRDLLAALDAMPVKRLVAAELQTADGEVCALGSLGRARGRDLTAVDTEDTHSLGLIFDIGHSLAAETMYQNDECGPRSKGWVRDGQGGWRRDDDYHETPEERWTRVRTWVINQIRVRPEELLPDPSPAVPL